MVCIRLGSDSVFNIINFAKLTDGIGCLRIYDFKALCRRQIKIPFLSHTNIFKKLDLPHNKLLNGYDYYFFMSHLFDETTNQCLGFYFIEHQILFCFKTRELDVSFLRFHKHI